jgi:tellurite methyltransferase
MPGLPAGPVRTHRYAEPVQRTISGYHQDGEGDWVADLSCGHGQHVRHRPPFQLREWVLEAVGRDVRLGTPLDCPLCDRAELPNHLLRIRTSPQWDEHTMPAGLERSHRIAEGTWGRIVVREGSLRFVAHTRPELNVILSSGLTQAIPPEVGHSVQPLGPVRFSIDFLSIPEDRERHSDLATRDAAEAGGEPACWAHLLCPECGAVLDGGPHRDGCY